MKKRIRIILTMLITWAIISCSQGLGPGYKFELFKNTPNWDLAKAVANEDEKEIKKIIRDQNLNINFQESKFGRTLLLLAIGNDKLISTRILLEDGAKVDIADSEKYAPIHEATKFVNMKKNSLQILELLIKYGADVNATLVKKNDNDTGYYYVPLMGASENLACAKLLLNHGANPYIKTGNTYPIWTFMNTEKLDENIFFAKYLIVDKRMPIPNPIDYSLPNKNPLDIFYFLDRGNFRGDLKKEKAKQEIMEYLRRINFPKSGVYNDTIAKK